MGFYKKTKNKNIRLYDEKGLERFLRKFLGMNKEEIEEAKLKLWSGEKLKTIFGIIEDING